MENVKLVSAHTGVLRPGNPRETSTFSQTNDTDTVSEDAEVFSKGQDKQTLHSRLTFI